jgi:hypothetical protein
MPGADHDGRPANASSAGASSIPARPEGEPHLTFHALLADTLHEMAVHDQALPPVPDAAATLCDEAVAALRATGGVTTPFHHSYLTPNGVPALPSRPARLDVRS